MLKHGVIRAITLHEGAFILGFRVIRKRGGEGQRAQGKPSGDDLGREAHLGEQEDRKEYFDEGGLSGKTMREALYRERERERQLDRNAAGAASNEFRKETCLSAPRDC